MTQRTNTAVEDFLIRIEQAAKMIEVHQVKLALIEHALTQLTARMQSLEKPSARDRLRDWWKRQLHKVWR